MKALRRTAKFLGATLTTESSGRSWVIKLEAPAGYVWFDGGIHELCGSCYLGNAAWRKDAIADMAERVSMGIERCQDPECEWCDR